MDFYENKTREELENPQLDQLPSLFDQIMEAMDEQGELPGGFRLRKADPCGYPFPFVDGGEDGVYLYHTRKTDGKTDELYAILDMILPGSAGARGRLEQFFAGKDSRPRRLLNYYGALNEWVDAHWEEPDPSNLLLFAVQTAAKSKYAECVKFALAFMAAWGIPCNELTEPLIETLALSDEFTFFCQSVVYRWEDGNEHIFQMAQHVHGCAAPPYCS